MKTKNLPRREKKKQPRPAIARSGGTTQRTLSHPLFGEIPLVEVTRTGPSGEVWRFIDFDPDYRPPIPAGGVVGDVRKQSYCVMCHAPRYFFIDETKRCIQCGRDFVFAAAEQKFWYETLKFHFDSTAIRCPGCRKLRRTDRFIRMQLELVANANKDKPGDPLILIGLADATLNYFQRFGQGNLAKAIAACRKARRLAPNLARAEELETRLTAAREQLQRETER